MVLSTSEFWAAFLSSVRLFFPELVDPNGRFPNTPPSGVAAEYDFVIVGAGTAGCVLASRLSEDPRRTVLLIEAGLSDDFRSDVPFLSGSLLNSDMDWNYTTVPQKMACRAQNGVCYISSGRVLGGSSTLSWTMYSRGNRADYDEWAELGNNGWGYDDVINYFIRSENMTSSRFARSPYHGSQGLLNVQYPNHITPMRDEYIRAGVEVGMWFSDYNGEYQTDVVDYGQFTINGALKENAPRSYLDLSRDRTNLDLITESVVSRVILEGKVAKGVEYFRNGKKHKVFAKKEVILSAGAIETPKLLLLSGIGPRKVLEEHDIEVLEDLPVGKNYQDHVGVFVSFKLNNSSSVITTDDWKSEEAIMAYTRYKGGPLTAAGAGSEAIAFLNPLDELAPPSVQVIFLSSSPNREKIMRTLVVNVDPKSVGHVKLRSKDFRDKPLIDPNFLEVDIDKETTARGIEKLLEFMASDTMSKYSPELITVTPCHGKTGKDYIECIVVQCTEVNEHPVGTARMGPKSSENSVVCSEDLRVRGLQKLRVVDGSVFPKIPRGNTLAPVIMVAEKAAIFIKNDYP